MADFPYYEREPTEMSDAETETEILKRIDALETQCHFFHRELERIEHLYNVVLGHELQLHKAESRIKQLEQLLQDDHK